MLLDRKTLDAMSDEDVNDFARDARAFGFDPILTGFFAPLFREERMRAELRLNRGIDAIRDVDRLVEALRRPTYFQGASLTRRPGFVPSIYGDTDAEREYAAAFEGTVALAGY